LARLALIRSLYVIVASGFREFTIFGLARFASLASLASLRSLLHVLPSLGTYARGPLVYLRIVHYGAPALLGASYLIWRLLGRLALDPQPEAKRFWPF